MPSAKPTSLFNFGFTAAENYPASGQLQTRKNRSGGSITPDSNFCIA